VTRYPQGPAASPGFLLWHLTLAWQRAVTAVLEPLGLTHVQFVLLACTWWLSSQGQVPNQLQLARQAGTDVKMTSQVERRLEAKGLLDRPGRPR
jgi:DNA-binding MarR family transcriptional regulator